MRYCFGRATSLLFSLAAVLIGVSSASAAVVDYTTTATFTCVNCVITGNGSGNVQVVYGSGANKATLLFTGVNSSVTSDGEFATAAFGTIKATSSGSGAFLNGTLTIGVDQLAPNTPPVTGAFPTATLTGKVFNGSSTSYANFGSEDPEIVLGGPVTYELDTSKKAGSKPAVYGYTIVSPTTGNPKGVTSFQGNIEATPEPAFLTLTGGGFVALSALAVRRRRKSELNRAV